ncbi:Palmitoyltransferase [Operophtera brumata]|uniref:Palmitoyltransferase n=1 Tax=Operophtera brumata TaxID=104452 RepID=A0A0L7LJL2_OPEBR|nr:Palmitoyltransferase [Operophtera brumata]
MLARNETSEIWDFHKDDAIFMEKFLLMDTPTTAFLILALYIVFVLKLGPQIMKNRPPYNLNNILRIYNALQVVSSAYVVYMGAPILWNYGLKPKCLNNTDDKIGYKVICTFLFILTPCFFIFEMTVVRPNIIQTYHLGIASQYLHLICSTFCYINVTGNMIMSILTDTSLKTSHENGTYCGRCNMYRPAKSWHCDTCNTCILRRDHHCMVFSRCIGLYNQRYYVSYLGYLFISMVYSAYYNYFFIAAKLEEYGLLYSILRICNPLLRFTMREPMAIEDIYGKENMLKVFGKKWYLAVICPFVNSPFPETGDQNKTSEMMREYERKKSVDTGTVLKRAWILVQF